MSKKRPLDSKSNVVVEKRLVTHLVDYMDKVGPGVFVTPAVANGTLFPPIDPITIAEEFKRKYSFTYKKFKTDVLVDQVKKAHEILSANSPINGGPGEKEAQPILDFYMNRGKDPAPGNTPSVPESPAVTQPAKKTKDFFSTPSSEKIVSINSSTIPSGDKSVFDDDEEDETTTTTTTNSTSTSSADATRGNPDSANSAMRALYSKGKDTPKDKDAAKLSKSAEDDLLKKLRSKQDRSTLPEYLQRKLAYKDMRLKGMSMDDAEKAAKKLSFGGSKDKEKEKPSAVIAVNPTVSFADVGGIEPILQDIRELIEYPLAHPEVYAHLGVEPPKGILLHGPTGCGKTLLAHAIAGELGVPLLKVSAPEIISGMSGESEAKIRQLFQDAVAQAPCILFIDEIDALAPKREDAQREMEKRIVAQLLSSMDGLSAPRKVETVQDTVVNEDGDSRSVAEFAMAANETEQGVDAQLEANKPVCRTVIVIGATNRVESLDTALRRAGRFDREIAMGIPDEEARARILQVMCRNLRVHPETDFVSLTRRTVGYVGADLSALTREAAVIAVNRIFSTIAQNGLSRSDIKAQIMCDADNDDDTDAPVEAKLKRCKLSSASASTDADADAGAVGAEGDVCVNLGSIGPSKSEIKEKALSLRAESYAALKGRGAPLSPEELDSLFILQADFETAIGKVQPTAKREGFATVPDVTWQDVGALDALQAELDMAIVQPITDPKLFESIGLSVPAGVLLFGPPGCGKTLVAKAVANESGASFLSVKGPELLNQYVGQSEAAVRAVFKRARTCAPCVIFFDEIDALVPKRGTSGNQASERVVNQLLTELDGMDERRNVFVVAATNRPDILDPAMLRPGRLDKLLYIALPDAEGRLSILKKHVRRTPLSGDVDIRAIAADPRAEGYSGADMNALVREATVDALKQIQLMKRDMMAKVDRSDEAAWAAVKAKTDEFRVVVCHRHFMNAFSKVRASVSAETRAKYDRMNVKFAQGRYTVEAQQEVQDGSSSASADMQAN